METKKQQGFGGVNFSLDPLREASVRKLGEGGVGSGKEKTKTRATGVQREVGELSVLGRVHEVDLEGEKKSRCDQTNKMFLFFFFHFIKISALVTVYLLCFHYVIDTEPMACW